jgi:predicted dehydrogenase
MLEKVECDMAIVCTPPITHPEVCHQLFDAGKHVLCEKPVSIDSESAKQMISTAQKAGVKFTMASKFRYVDDMMRAKSMLETDMIGELLAFENYFTSPVVMTNRWNADPDISGGGVLIDNGTHSVDIAHYLLGPISEVEAVEGKRYQTLPVEDTVSVLLRTQSGAAGRIELSWSISLQRRGFVNLVGANGVIVVGWQTSAYKLNDSDQWVKFGTGYDKFHAFASQLENFTAAIERDEPLLITPNDALASVEVIEVAYAALHGKSWRPVSYERRDRFPVSSGYSAVMTH